MYLFVTKKKRSKWMRESLEGMVDYCDKRMAQGDLDLDLHLARSATAAETLLQIWFEEDEEA